MEKLKTDQCTFYENHQETTLTFGMSLCIVTLVKPGPLNYKK